VAAARRPGGAGHRGQRGRRRAPGRRPPGPGHLPRLPGSDAGGDRGARSGTARPTGGTGTRSPTAPTAAPGSASSGRSPTTGPTPPWRGSALSRTAGRSTRTPWTGGSTPSPRPVPACGPRLAWIPGAAPSSPGSRHLAGGGGGDPGRPGGGGEGAGRVPPGGGRHERGGGGAAAGRKRRATRPLAVMVTGLAMARELCEVSDAAAALLEAPEAPIVLLRRRRVAHRQRRGARATRTWA
jgi:translation initiation factor IF-2